MESSTADQGKRGVTRRGVARVALLIVLACVGAGLGYLRTWPPVATVMSGSMSPTIETGDVVVMGKLQRAPRVGDVIAVSVPDAARERYGYPSKVIHRITRIGPDGQITTKGDARKKVDPFTVPRSTVQTGVVATLPGAGRVLAFLGSTLGLIWLAAGALLLIVMPLFDRQRETVEAEREEMEALRGDVEAMRADLQAALEELVRAQAATTGTQSPSQDALERRITELTAMIEAALTPPDTETVVMEPEHGGTTYLRLAEPEPEPDREPEPEWSPTIEPWTNVFGPQQGPRPLPQWDPPPRPVARTRSGGLLGLIERRAR